MQDTKNLIKKRDIEYPKLIKEAKLSKNSYDIVFWEQQLENVKNIIESRKKNRIKNKKQYKKKH